jgi:tyrosyl-tRNA synthetase
MKNIVEELKWRGLVHDIIPGTEAQLLKEATTAYIGFDPTSDSLHIGSLVPIILLKHMKNFGHNPIAVVGGATGMIGDPSGKSSERNLLDEETLNKNVEGIKNTLTRFLGDTPVLNNYDWMSKFSFIDFVRDIGKRITVNYMLSKQSVKNRIEGEGMSFTEFTYQLIQGYDFLHLNKEHNCLLQMGGSDQWGNITTGTELIHKMFPGREAFAMTCPLLTKADGKKFGKSEGGNIWLDKDKTSVYKFFQFWLNTDDADAERFIKIFTFLDKETIDNLIEEHNKARHLFLLQKSLAKELTIMVHGEEEFNKVVEVSNILFNNGSLHSLDSETILDIFSGLPMANIPMEEIVNGITMTDILFKTGFLKSNNEARRALKENSVAVNKIKREEIYIVTDDDLINDKFIIVQRGKKNYFLVVAS